MDRRMYQIPVRPEDRKVFDEIRKRERRGLSDQFGVLLDHFCTAHNLERKTGKPKTRPVAQTV